MKILIETKPLKILKKRKQNLVS